MPEILYTVTVSLPDAATAGDWLQWLRDGHIADVLAGGATAAAIVALDGIPHTYEARYRFPSRAAFDRYEQAFAPRLRAEGLERFPVSKGISYRRTVGEVLNEFGRPQ
jgi:uncharacterized protein DUF4286